MKRVFTFLLSFSFVLSAFANETISAVMDQKSCKFVYPKGALFSEEEGTTTVQAVVNANGTVESVKLASSSGSKSLDKATIEAITNCKFKAGTVDGKPATTTAVIAYSWKLSK